MPGLFSCSEVVERGARIFFSFLSVKPAEKLVQIGTSKDEVSLGFRTLKLFIVECLSVCFPIGRAT